MFTIIDYHFFIRLSRGILLFFEKYFIFYSNIQLIFTKTLASYKKSQKVAKKQAERRLPFRLLGTFFTKNVQKVGFFKSAKKPFVYGTKLDCAHQKCNSSTDNTGNYTDEQSAEVGTCIATTMTALACDCVCQKEDPTDYGNGIQNATPKVVPRREGSVCLGEKHIGVLSVDFVLFHSFFTLSSAIAEILHL